MHIVVCIKQVPSSSNVKVDSVTGILIRDGQNTRINPYDLFAIELALSIKKQSDTISVVTMGPPSATEVLKEALYMGCDDAYLLSDRKFAGSDVLTTSYTIAQGINSIPPVDVIICGKQTTDGDTSQVGPEVAENLKMPHLSNVVNIKRESDAALIVTSNIDEFIYEQKITTPCLLCADTNINTPRLPSYKLKKLKKDIKITTITFNELKDQEAKNYGLEGSPTQILQIYQVEKNDKKILHEGSTGEITSVLYKTLKETKLI